MGALFGSPESCRRVPGNLGTRAALSSLLSGEQEALREQEALQEQYASNAALPPSPLLQKPPPQLLRLPSDIVSSPSPRVRKVRDEPSAQDVLNALHQPPVQAPTPRHSSDVPRQGNVLSSPRRTSILGETLRHASQWQTSSYELETPYAMETRDSRFLEAEADKAALAAVASTAGLAVASGPSAGLSTNRRNTHFDLPSMRREMLTPR